MRLGGDSWRTHCPVRRHCRSLAHCIKRRVTQVAAHGADVQRCEIDQGTLSCISGIVLVGKAGSLGAHLTEIPRRAHITAGGLALPELGDTGMRAGSSDHRNDPGVRHTLLLAH